MAALERDDIQRVRRNPWWLAVGATPWAAAIVLLGVAAVLGNPGILFPLGHLMVFGVVGLAFMFRANRSPRFVSGALSIDDTVIRHGGVVACERREVTGGLVHARDGRWFVRLERGRLKPAVMLAARSEGAARDVLRALGLDASQSVAKVRGLSPMLGLTGPKQLLFSALPAMLLAGAFIGGRFFGMAAGAIGAVAFVIASIFTVALLATRTEISIGADGILTRWLGRETFHPFAELAEVVPVERGGTRRYLGLELRGKDGSTTFLPLAQRGYGDDGFHATCERVREALEVYASCASADAASLVERGERTPSQWVEALKRIGAGADASMRRAPVDPDALGRVLGDASARPSARASAAIALSAGADQGVRLRIKAAAETAAEPRLRIALERAAEPTANDEELAELLAELEAAEADGPARRRA